MRATGRSTSLWLRISLLGHGRSRTSSRGMLNVETSIQQMQIGSANRGSTR